MNNLLWMLGDPNNASSAADEMLGDIDTLWTGTVEPILEKVIWALIAVLAVVFIIKAVTTAMAVMRAADEPQVRQEKLNGFKYLAIGLGVAIIVLTFANVIMSWITERQVELGDLKDTSSFLF